MLLTIDGEDKEAVGAKIQEYLKDLREERYVDAGGRSNEVAVIITGKPLELALEHHLDAFGELGVQALSPLYLPYMSPISPLYLDAFGELGVQAH